MSRIKFKFFIIVFLIAVLSGCEPKLKFWEKPQDTGPDVMQARDCGQEGLQCCNENPPCSYGMQCCTDPSNPGINQCANNCSCGKEDAFCCKEGSACEEGFSCYNGLCKKCGGLKQPCCGVDSCQEKLGCLSGLCFECGLNNNPCCQAEKKCINQEILDKERAECNGSICQPCGSYGNISCFGKMKCLPGNLLNNDLCYKCGSANQPCCNKDSGLGYECDPKDGLSCIVGFCNK
jgi:hypothetical protein